MERHKQCTLCDLLLTIIQNVWGAEQVLSCKQNLAYHLVQADVCVQIDVWTTVLVLLPFKIISLILSHANQVGGMDAGYLKC